MLKVVVVFCTVTQEMVDGVKQSLYDVKPDGKGNGDHVKETELFAANVALREVGLGIVINETVLEGSL